MPTTAMHQRTSSLSSALKAQAAGGAAPHSLPTAPPAGWGNVWGDLELNEDTLFGAPAAPKAIARPAIARSRRSSEDRGAEEHSSVFELEEDAWAAPQRSSRVSFAGSDAAAEDDYSG